MSIYATALQAATPPEPAQPSQTIAVGKDASLVALKSDPSRDITAIRDAVMVFKKGSIVLGRRSS